MRTAVAVLLVTLAGAGCGPHRGPGPATPQKAGSVLMLHVENDQWSDMDIYVAGGIGAPQVVGIVPGKSDRYFELPHALFDGADELRLIAEPFGSTQRIVSEPLQVGDQSVEWLLDQSGRSRLNRM